MPSFEDLGLRPELVRALEDEEIAQPTALQEGVIPALRRGGNLVARASTGSGKTLAYGLGVLDRLTAPAGDEEESSLRFLVLAPTVDEAERVALQLFPYAQAVGLAVTVPGGSWGTATSQAEVVVTPVADIMEGVRGSAVKLDSLEAVVVDGAAAIHQLGDWERVDTLLDLVPRDAQRVVVSPSFPAEVSELIDRRVKRALRWPAEPAVPEEAPQQKPAGSIGYVLVPGSNKLEVLARQLSQGKEEGGPPPVLFCRSDERAAEVAELLSVRGFAVGSAADAEVDVAVAAADTTRAELLEEADEGVGQTISFDVPADVATLLARHGGDDDAVIMVQPRELPHVRELGRAANLRVRPLPLPVEPGASAADLAAFRDQLRQAVQTEDLTAQMLVLAPLFDELGAAEVAAACAALLRRRPAAPSTAPREAPARAAPAAEAAGTAPAPKPWARLFVSIGSRDDIRPGDLVGALAGESDIKGNQIGKIEIRDSFSVVEVQADVADRVIRAVNGTTIKGRSVRVDYDRPGARGPQRADRRQSNRPGAPPGRGPGRGPGGGGGGPRRVVKRPRPE